MVSSLGSSKNSALQSGQVLCLVWSYCSMHSRSKTWLQGVLTGLVCAETQMAHSSLFGALDLEGIGTSPVARNWASVCIIVGW